MLIEEGIKDIYVWEEYSWQPSNAYCWYKFDGNYADSTGTHSVATGTSSFATLDSGIKVLQTDGSNVVLLPSTVTASSLSTYTIAFWMKPISNNSYYAGCGTDNTSSTLAFYTNTSGRCYYEWSNAAYKIDVTPSGIGSNWRLVIIRKNGTTLSQVINGSIINTNSNGVGAFGWGSQFAIGARYPVYTTKSQVYMSNLIISKTYWDDATCLEMYNQTKSNYGL